MPSPELVALRQQLDELDAEIVRILAARIATVEEVANTKERDSDEVRDHERERYVLERAEGVAERLGVSPAFVRSVFERIIEYSVEVQRERRNGTGAG